MSRRKPRIKIKHVFLHLRKIGTHRKWVRWYCFKSGLFWQGLVHDLSKYSPTEFWESVRYYQGDRSPIAACKEDRGVSMGWFHHRGRNRHHWEYWVDDFDKGVIPKLMPEKYALEMLCDFMAAARAYNGNHYSPYDECNWWERKSKEVVSVMHPVVRYFIDDCMDDITKLGEDYVFDHHAAVARQHYRDLLQSWEKGREAARTP